MKQRIKQVKKRVFYEVDPRYFKDGNNDGSGDLNGMANNMEYFFNLGVDTIILQNILSTTTNEKHQNFNQLAGDIGITNDLTKLISIARTAKIDILIEMPIGGIKENHEWFETFKITKNEQFTDLIQLHSKKETTDNEIKNAKQLKGTRKYYVKSEDTQEVSLNWKSQNLQQKFSGIFEYWNDLGVSGFVFKDFEYLTNKHRDDKMNMATMKELRKLYRGIKSINHKLITIASSTIIALSDAKALTNGSTKVFDYFLAEQVSLLGSSKKFGTDKISTFKTSELASYLKRIGRDNSLLLSFGSQLTGRVNSRWGDHGEYWAESAKGIALLQFLLPSSPVIYYGEEIGTLNIGLTHLDDFQDATLEERKKVKVAKGLKEKDFMDAQVLFNKINSKTAMSWNDVENAGFSHADKIAHPIPYTYRKINVAKQYQDEASVLNFYKKLISWGRSTAAGKIVANGKYSITSIIPGLVKIDSTLGEKQVVTYVNLTDKTKKIRKPKEGKVVFSSYSYRQYKTVPASLEAFESIVVTKKTDESIRNTKLIELEKFKDNEETKRQVILKDIRIQKVNGQHDSKIIMDDNAKVKSMQDKKQMEVRQQEKDLQNKLKNELKIKKEEEKTQLLKIKEELKEQKQKTKQEEHEAKKFAKQEAIIVSNKAKAAKLIAQEEKNLAAKKQAEAEERLRIEETMTKEIELAAAKKSSEKATKKAQEATEKAIEAKKAKKIASREAYEAKKSNEEFIAQKAEDEKLKIEKNIDDIEVKNESDKVEIEDVLTDKELAKQEKLAAKSAKREAKAAARQEKLSAKKAAKDSEQSELMKESKTLEVESIDSIPTQNSDSNTFKIDAEYTIDDISSLTEEQVAKTTQIDVNSDTDLDSLIDIKNKKRNW